MAIFGSRHKYELIENIDELRDNIKEIIQENIRIDDPYCGFEGADDATDEIIDLLKNNFMLFFN